MVIFWVFTVCGGFTRSMVIFQKLFSQCSFYSFLRLVEPRHGCEKRYKSRGGSRLKVPPQYSKNLARRDRICRAVNNNGRSFNRKQIIAAGREAALPIGHLTDSPILRTAPAFARAHARLSPPLYLFSHFIGIQL